MAFEAPYAIDDPAGLLSPSLVVFAEVVRANLRAMVAMAGGADRLRPHAKTHKMPAVIRLLGEYGISKHKCATIAEAEMIAQAGGADVLLAYPLVGPNLPRFARLIESYPATTFRAVVEDEAGARALDAIGSPDRPVSTLVDLDLGMGRTGIDPGSADAVCGLVDRLKALRFDGLHGYDGHVREPGIVGRRAEAGPGLRGMLGLRDRLIGRGIKVRRLVLGGTPSFPVHAGLDLPGVELSPGTGVFHDAGYGAKFPDLPFTPAALLLTRVVSRPRAGRLCLDLGHKAVAADPIGARLSLLGVEGATLGGQSEEHLIVESADSDRYPPGTPLLAIPTHVCPTCALHGWAYVIEGGKPVDRWQVTARDRVLTI